VENLNGVSDFTTICWI